MIKAENVSVKYLMAYDRIKSMKEYLVQLVKGNIQYEEFWALQDVSFEVKKGEVLGIIGHNGAGKSTLLKVISGILKPTSGGVQVNGTVVPMLELGSGFDFDLTRDPGVPGAVPEGEVWGDCGILRAGAVH